MTINASSSTSAAVPDRRVLDTDDPSEFLAETRICLRQVPADSLVILGHGGAGSPPMMTTTLLSHVLSAEGPDQLEEQMSLMLARGSARASAMFVLGDGYEELPTELVDTVAVLASARLLVTAEQLLPEPFRLGTVWVVGGGEGRQVVLGERDGAEERILVSPPRPLRGFSETRAAAEEVLTGRMIPQESRVLGQVAPVAQGLQLRRTDLAASCDPGELFLAAKAALERIGAEGYEPAGPGFMTDCEHIASVLSALAVDRLHWELLAQCVDHGNEGSIDREQLLQILVREGKWAPDADVCAGGSWYQALEVLREVAARALQEVPPAQQSIAREAWRGLTAMLVILSWWNHRFATGGGFVDDLWEREPGSTLAPLLARMTDTPIFPAWWPST